MYISLFCVKLLTRHLNSVGFFQEYRAEKTMDSLRQLSSPTAFVIRNGEGVPIPAKNVVPGDIIQIKTGDVVPADVSLFNYISLISTFTNLFV